MAIYHNPVLQSEVLEYSGLNDEGLMLDMNLGEGGHSSLFLTKYPHLNVIGVDADKKIIERANERLLPFGKRFKSVHSWSDDYLLSYKGVSPNLIFFDLGLSMFHFKGAERGFSFNDDVLDMRLNEENELTAKIVVNSYKEEKLASIIYEYGGEKKSRYIAKRIVEERKNKKIESSKELHSIVDGCFSKKERLTSKIDPATRTFQAIRIEVNDELLRFQRALKRAYEILSIKGRIEVISFHSLEDGIAKWYFRSLKEEGLVDILTKKPIVPSEKEKIENSASHSSKLRVVQKVR